jgi:hypothetical protein
MSRNVPSRFLFALPLAFVVLACGGAPSDDQMTPPSEQSAAEKPFDSGDTQPVTPAPSTRADRAIDLRPHGRSTDGVQAQYAAFSFSVSNTNNATVNTFDVSFHLYAGETITIGTCGVNGGSGTGDTYLRLYSISSGAELVGNDDACGGVLSNMTYTAPAAMDVTLRAGCFGNTACSGTYGVTEVRPLGSYSASNTNSAQVNSYDYFMYMYPGFTYIIGTCGTSGGSGTGDTYLRLYDPSGTQVAFNDDAGGSCGVLSTITYSPPTYGAYMIRAGCYSSNTCSGTVSVLLP